MISVANWKLLRNSVPLAHILKFLPNLAQNKVVATALDGSIYIQTIGNPIKQSSVEVLASREEMAAVNQAEADGALVSCIYRDVQYVGYMDGQIEWDAVEPGVWYTGSFKLLIEEEMSV